MLILKLGGAAITDKRTPNTPNKTLIAQVVQRIAAHPQPLILIHGAGSYGHILAEQFDLQHGYKMDTQRGALAQLQAQLMDLNQIVVRTLNDAGVIALPVHPASMCVMDQGRITALFDEPIRRMLDLQIVPVLYGDCVWDRAQVFGIISGDQLAIYLANALGAERVAFGTNVDGVLDESGQIVRRFDPRALPAAHSGESARADVTGGMLGKLREIAALEKKDAHAWIFNLHNLDDLEAVLSGTGHPGTLIISSEE